MFGIPIGFDQVHTAFESFFNSDGMTVLLALTVASGVGGMILAALRSVSGSKK